MMDYACPAMRFVTRTHIWRLQIIQSKCLCLATGAPWNEGRRQNHEDLGVPFFAGHIRALIASLDLKLADVVSPFFLATRQKLTLIESFCGGQVDVMNRVELFSWAPFGYLDWGFSLIFLRWKVNARVYEAKLRLSQHSPTQAWWLPQCVYQ
jgi:hypothetical protein